MKETIREIIISDNQPGGQILSCNRVSFDGFVQVFIAVSCVSVVSFRWFRSVVSVVLVVSFRCFDGFGGSGRFRFRYPCIIESCRKSFNFHNKIPLCLLCIENVELERKAEKFSKEPRNGAARRSHFILEQTAQLINEAVQFEHCRGEMTVPLLRTTQVVTTNDQANRCSYSWSNLLTKTKP